VTENRVAAGTNQNWRVAPVPIAIASGAGTTANQYLPVFETSALSACAHRRDFYFKAGDYVLALKEFRRRPEKKPKRLSQTRFMADRTREGDREFTEPDYPPNR